MNDFLAIDPGADRGWAWYRNRVLFSCGLGDLPVAAIPICIIERPVVYRGTKKPEDIITLAIRVGESLQCMRALGGPVFEVYVVEPHAWKGSVPKGIHNARILDQLSPAELDVLKTVKAPAGKKHNVIDAIGLGKWFIKNKNLATLWT